MIARLFPVSRLVVLGTLVGAIAACTAAPAPPTTAPKDTSNDDNSQQSTSPTTPATAATTPPAATAAPTTGVTVTAVSPPSIPAGSSPSGLTITLTGTNFVNGFQLSVGTETVAATVTSPTSLTAVVPPDQLTVPASLPIAVVQGTNKSNVVNLTVLAPGATTGSGSLIALNPSSAPVATTPNGSMPLTVTGQSFTASSVIVFNGVTVPTLFQSVSTLQGNVPNALLSSAGLVQVSVRNNGTISGSLPFTIGNGSVGGFPGFPGVCQQTCDQVGLFPGECANVGGIQFGPFNIGGQDVSCDFNNCIQSGCPN